MSTVRSAPPLFEIFSWRLSWRAGERGWRFHTALNPRNGLCHDPQFIELGVRSCKNHCVTICKVH